MRRHARVGFRMAKMVFWVVLAALRGTWQVRRVPANERSRCRAANQTWAGRKICRAIGVQVQVEGRLPERSGGLSVSNHLGVLDPWLLAASLPIAFAAKSEMQAWPVMGWACRVAGVVFVERERRSATPRFVAEVRDRMDSGVRVHVFPEGTTSDGLDLLPFKTGGFAAISGNDRADVVPVFLHVEGVEGRPATLHDRFRAAWQDGESMWRHAYRQLVAREATYRVVIGAAIDAAQEDRKTLASRAQDAVTALDWLPGPLEAAEARPEATNERPEATQARPEATNERPEG